MKILTILLSIMVFSSISEASQFSFDLKKGAFFNKHSLIVSNQDPKRTISFSGCFNNASVETDYYVLMNNGSKHYIDSKIFCQIGMKGRYWINSSDKGVIPFKIKKEIMRNAQEIVFKGVTFIPVRTGSFVDSTDMRELVVTYDVDSGETVFNVSDEVLKQSTLSSEIFNIKKDSDLSTINLDDYDGVLDKGIEIDDFRLRSKK